MDVLTAHALFPRAPALFLVGDLPIGRPWCLAHARCAAAASTATIDYFLHILQYELAWTYAR